MRTYNDVEVMINGKSYTLCGYESNDYMQMVATYLNDKYEEVRTSKSYNKMDQEMKGVMMQLNIADDYLKTREKLLELEEELEKKNTSIFELKQENNSLQSQVYMLQEELEKRQQEHIKAQKEVVKVESKLEEDTQKLEEGK